MLLSNVFRPAHNHAEARTHARRHARTYARVEGKFPFKAREALTHPHSCFDSAQLWTCGPVDPDECLTGPDIRKGRVAGP